MKITNRCAIVLLLATVQTAFGFGFAQVVVSSFAGFKEVFENKSTTEIILNSALFSVPLNASQLTRVGSLNISCAKSICEFDGSCSWAVNHFDFAYFKGISARELDLHLLNGNRATLQSFEGAQLRLENVTDMVKVLHSRFSAVSSLPALSVGENVSMLLYGSQLSAISGGCLRLASASLTDISDSLFSDCTLASGSGAGLYATGDDVRIRLYNTTFSGMVAPAGGGSGLWVSSAVNSSLLVVNCTFSKGTIGLQTVSSSSVSLFNTSIVCGTSSAAPETGSGIFLADFYSSTVRLSGVDVHRCGAASHGGGVFATGFVRSTMDVTSSAFSQLAAEWGGAIALDHWSDSSVFTGRLLRISECDASQYGGGFFAENIYASTVGLSDTDFFLLGQDTAPQFGGALYLAGFYSDSLFWMNHTTVEKCVSTELGPAMYAVTFFFSSSLHLFNCTFSNLGSVSAPSFPLLTIFQFHQLDALSGSLAFGWFEFSSVRLVKVLVTDTTVSNYGGGVHLRAFQGAVVDIIDCNLHKLGKSPSFPQLGGAVYLDTVLSSTVTLSGVVIEHCQATIQGAGLYAQDLKGTKLVIKDSRFSHLGKDVTPPPQSGGAIYVDGLVLDDQGQQPSIVMRNVVIEDCVASSSGAGLYLGSVADSAVVSLENVTFNHLGRPHSGGAMFLLGWRSSSLHLRGVKMQDCAAAVYAGGIYSEDFIDSAITIVGSTLSDLSGFDGGGVMLYKWERSACRLQNVDFSRCSAADVGGGFLLRQVSSSNVSLSGAAFQSCSAQVSAAAIRAEWILGSQITASCQVFCSKAMPVNGGAVGMSAVLERSQVTLVNSTFVGCQSSFLGGAIFAQGFQNNSKFAVKDSRFELSAASVAIGQAVYATLFAGSEFLLQNVAFNLTESLTNHAVVLEVGRNAIARILALVPSLQASNWDAELTIADYGTSQFDGSLLGAVTLVNLRLALPTRFNFQGVQSLTVLNCSFLHQNSLDSLGWLAVRDVGFLTVKDTSFIGCHRAQRCIGCVGGSLVLDRVIGLFENARFENSHSVGSGGAVYVGMQSDITFLASSWLNCTAVGRGGALFVDQASVAIVDGKFDDCSSTVAGGSLFADSSNVVLSNVSVSGSSSASGGAFSFANCESVEMAGVTATDTTASSFGGAFHFQTVDFTRLSQVFVRNSLAQSGGSVFLDTVRDCAIDQSRFVSSSSIDEGGALQLFSSSCNVSGSTFSNASSYVGGVVFLAQAQLIASNVTMEDSFANQGGAVASSSSTVTFLNSTIARCSAGKFGGAIADYDGAVSASGCAFEDNSALGNGGAIYAFSNSSVSLLDCRLSRSQSENGGAIYLVQDARLTAERSGFDSNAARGAGGAVLFAPTSARENSINSSHFVNNSASTFGGAVSLQDPQAALMFDENCSFFFNSAATGGAVYFVTKKVPESLLTSTNGGNVATFTASGPVELVVSPAKFEAQSKRPFSVVAVALDYASNVVNTMSDQCVLFIAQPGDAVAIAGGSGSFVNGTASIPYLVLTGSPGANGVLVASSGQDLRVEIPYSLRNCAVGEISHQEECTECEFGSYAVSLEAMACTPCPGGAVCVNGSTIWPEWGRWKMENSTGVCSGSVCSLPECLVEDACEGVQEIQVNSTSRRVTGRVYSFDIVGGCSAALAAAARFGDPVLFNGGRWAVLRSLNCSKQTKVLTVEGTFNWLISSSELLLPLVFVSPSCHAGYSGPLCSKCSPGFARTVDVECQKCESTFMTFLLTSVYLLVACAVVTVLTWLTLRHSGGPSSQLVSILKVLWTYAQLMALCSRLRVKWPSLIQFIFHTQETASTVSSRQLVSLDCVLRALGVGDGSSLFVHVFVMMLVPIAWVAVVAVFWCLVRCAKGADPAGRETSYADRFTVTCLTVLFLLYPTLCNDVFSLFPCQRLSSTGSSFMSYDLAEPCEGFRHTLAVLAGLLGVALYSFGIPALSLVLVWRKRWVLRSLRTRKAYGFLYLGYSSKCYFFESIVMLRKMLLGVIALFSLQLGPVLSTLMATLLFLVSYILQGEMKPFDDPNTGGLEKLSGLSLLAFSLTGTAFASQSVDGIWILLAVAGLVSVNLVFFASALLLAVRAAKMELKPLLAKFQTPKKRVEMNQTINPLK